MQHTEISTHLDNSRLPIIVKVFKAIHENQFKGRSIYNMLLIMHKKLTYLLNRKNIEK